MKIGIVGLPNVGKSTMFNSITKAGAECANYPFCTIEPNVGIVAVPDERIDKLAEMYKPQKVTKAVVEFVDIAGLVKGASKGEGLGNKFLSHIREVDAICQVVRCFEDPNVIHVDGSVNPLRDIETINLELIFADLETLDKRLDKAKKNLKADKKYQAEIDLIEKLKENLNNGIPARAVECNEDEQELVKDMFLLTSKPIIYIANISEKQIQTADDEEMVKQVKEYAAKEHAEVIPLCVKIEEELSGLDDSDKKEISEFQLDLTAGEFIYSLIQRIKRENNTLDKITGVSTDILPTTNGFSYTESIDLGIIDNTNMNKYFKGQEYYALNTEAKVIAFELTASNYNCK